MSYKYWFSVTPKGDKIVLESYIMHKPNYVTSSYAIRNYDNESSTDDEVLSWRVAIMYLETETDRSADIAEVIRRNWGGDYSGALRKQFIIDVLNEPVQSRTVTYKPTYESMEGFI